MLLLFDIFSREAYDRILNSFVSGVRLKLCSPWIFSCEVEKWRSLSRSIFFCTVLLLFFLNKKQISLRYLSQSQNSSSFARGLMLYKSFGAEISILDWILREPISFNFFPTLSSQNLCEKGFLWYFWLVLRVLHHEIIAYIHWCMIARSYGKISLYS